MQSNSPTTDSSPSSSRCRNNVCFLETQRPSPVSCTHGVPLASPKRRNGNYCHSQPTSCVENDFPRLLFLDDNSTEDENDTFKIHRKLLRRRYVRREQNRKKRQREMEKAKKLESEVEKHQIHSNSHPTSPQSTSKEDPFGQLERQQRLLCSPSFSVSCGMGSPCSSPGISVPCFSPLRAAKRRKTRAAS